MLFNPINPKPDEYLPVTRKAGKHYEAVALVTEQKITQPWQSNTWGCLGRCVIKHESILEENNTVLLCPPFDNR